MSNKTARICDNNRIEDAVVTAAEDASFPFVNSFDLINRNQIYKPGTKSFTIEIDLQSNQKNVSFFCILGESNEILKISNDATITVKASSINLFDGTEPVSQVVSVGELGIYYDFTDDTNQYGYNYRYWQIVIDDSLNPDDIEIAYIYLGDHVIFDRNISNGFNYVIQDNSQIARSDTGKIFTRQRPEQTTISGAGIRFMDVDDKNAILSAVRRIGRFKPFVFVIDPTQCRETLDFAVKPMYFTRVPIFTQQVRNIYSSSFSMREVL